MNPPKDIWTVTHTATAWESIGHDGTFRIKGGRALYDAVIYQCGPREGRTVTLARLGQYHGHEVRGLEQTNRRVEPDTVLEFLTPKKNQK